MGPRRVPPASLTSEFRVSPFRSTGVYLAIDSLRDGVDVLSAAVFPLMALNCIIEVKTISMGVFNS